MSTATSDEDSDYDFGWPWMKGAVDVTKTGVIAESSEASDDPRPLVKDLIDQYQESIAMVQVTLMESQQQQQQQQQLYSPEKHDALWILRFLLSHKNNTDRAVQAIQTTLQYRNKFQLDKKDIRSVPPQHRSQLPKDHAISRFFQTIPATACIPEQTEGETQLSPPPPPRPGIGWDGVTGVVPSIDKYGVVMYLNIASINPHELAKLPQEDWIAAMSYVNEWQFQWNDYLTRTTGKLTKDTHIVDVAGISKEISNPTCRNKFTTATKTLSDCYPQNVGAYLVCHAPFWIQVPWKILRPLLPVRVVAKLDFLNPHKDPKDLQRILSAATPSSQLPTRFGGENPRWPPKFEMPKLSNA